MECRETILRTKGAHPALSPNSTPHLGLGVAVSLALEKQIDQGAVAFGSRKVQRSGIIFILRVHQLGGRIQQLTGRVETTVIGSGVERCPATLYAGGS